MIVSGVGKTYSNINILSPHEKKTSFKGHSLAIGSRGLNFKCFMDLFKISPKKFSQNFIGSKSGEEFASNITNVFPEAGFLMKRNSSFKKKLNCIKDILSDNKSPHNTSLSKLISDPKVLMGVVFLLIGSAAVESYRYANLLKKSNTFSPQEIDAITSDNNKMLNAVIDNWHNMLPSFSNLYSTTQEDVKSILQSDFNISKAETMEVTIFDLDEYKKLSDSAKSILLSKYFIDGLNNTRAASTVEVLDASRDLSSEKILDSLVENIKNELKITQENQVPLVYLSRMFNENKVDLIKSAYAELSDEKKNILVDARKKGLKIQNEKDFVNSLYTEIHKQMKNKKNAMGLTLSVLVKIYDSIKDKPATKEGYIVSQILLRDLDQPVEWLKQTGFYQSSNGVIYPKYSGDRIPALIVASAFKTPWKASSIKTIEQFLDKKTKSTTESVYLAQIFEPKYRHGYDEDEIHLDEAEFKRAIQYLTDKYKDKLLSEYSSKYNL